MMSKQNIEVKFRQPLSRLRLALEEMNYIRSNIYDCGSLVEAEKLLEEVIGHFILARDVATGELGFIPQDSMPT